MKALLGALPAYWRTAVAGMLQYRAAIALWAVWGVVYPAVALIMWAAAARSSGRTHLGGYDPHDFAAYFLLTMIVSHVTAAWDIFEMGWLVRTGQMSPRLLRPILPVWASLMDNLAYKVVTLVILVPAWLLVAGYFQPRFHTTPAHVALGLPALVLAAAINFIWGYTLALLAFWTTRTDGLGETYYGLSMLLGGRFAPLALLPGLLQWLPWLLPFKWIYWFPTETLSGRLALPDVAGGLLWQLGWLTAGLLALRLFWRESLRRYTAVGA